MERLQLAPNAFDRTSQILVEGLESKYGTQFEELELSNECGNIHFTCTAISTFCQGTPRVLQLVHAGGLSGAGGTYIQNLGATMFCRR